MCKHLNHIVNNIAFNNGGPIFYDGPLSPEETVFEIHGAANPAFKHNVIYFEGSSKVYNIIRGNEDMIRKFDADYNCYYVEGKTDGEDKLAELRQTFGKEKNSIAVDPKISFDYAARRLKFAKDSPLHALGIKEIDVHNAGLTKDFPGKFRKHIREYNDPYCEAPIDSPLIVHKK